MILGSKTGIRLAFGAAFLLAVLLLSAPQASAQITPSPTNRDYCAEWSSPSYQGPPGRFRAVPASANLNLSLYDPVSSTVTASMFQTIAPCIDGENSKVCSPTGCSMTVLTVCEFHCYHDHTAPYHWEVALVANPSGAYHVGWTGTTSCAVNKAAPQSACLVRMNTNQNMTAVFEPTPDTTPPAAPSTTPGAVTPYSATINWTPSADNKWLGGYEIVQNGSVLVARLSTAFTSFKIENLRCETTYTFRVDAYDTANKAASNNVQATTGKCLTTAKPRPNTMFHIKPPRVTRSRTAFFHFGVRGNVPATKYQCKLDRGRWRACSGRSGKTYRSLKRGYHTVYVRAGNAAGFDPTPAKWRWRIR
jgi:hypothetical protein